MGLSKSAAAVARGFRSQNRPGVEIWSRQSLVVLVV